MGTGLEIQDVFDLNDEWALAHQDELDEFMRDVSPEPADLLARFWQHVEGVRGIPTLEKNRIAGLLNAFASNNGIDFTVKEVWS